MVNPIFEDDPFYGFDGPASILQLPDIDEPKSKGRRESASITSSSKLKLGKKSTINGTPSSLVDREKDGGLEDDYLHGSRLSGDSSVTCPEFRRLAREGESPVKDDVCGSQIPLQASPANFAFRTILKPTVTHTRQQHGEVPSTDFDSVFGAPKPYLSPTPPRPPRQQK